MQRLSASGISSTLFNLTSPDVQEKYFDFLNYHTEYHLEAYTIFFANHHLYEHILLEIYDRNYIRRNLVYIFNWGRLPLERNFVRNIEYAMKIYVITNPRTDTFRLFYSQATSHREHHLDMVNWWNHGKGLFSHPTLPIMKSVYKDFKGKVLQVPVLHKPPWYFVRYNNSNNGNFSNINNTMEVLGGRDDRILSLLSQKLNFRYNYFDPPEHIQGTPDSESGVFSGVLGLIWRREADLFLGDVALTYERSNFVEFSFLTLADSGAFVTHAPSKLNEALALLRPFHWQVWPAILVTCLAVGPMLYIIIALPNAWQPRFRVRSHARLFFDCTWFTITILLKQTGRLPSSSHKARFFIILLSISATYVITDMYSANLTSLLARPGRERAVNNLYQLEKAMESRGYSLFVESHSSSYGLLENGTGIYGNLWDLMKRNQGGNVLVQSVEEGVKLVRDSDKIAVMAGRETLYFDIQRFGPSNFHLSEKLNTAYSAIALQLGCPYIEEINRILMATFEAGIITKMTENEYEKLGKQKEISMEVEENLVSEAERENPRKTKANEDSEKLKPISIKMLQGTFYLLCLGNAFSGLILLAEILFYKHQKKYRVKKKRLVAMRKFSKFVRFQINKLRLTIRRLYRNVMHDAFVATLEYIE
ncbi:ionotropic receptor 40a [Anoplophora glabripennis]|uniref:ionotropic receptor 40a n=1 Tax=Anoplophora glabripennis TaxID=217634 RepID=UPI000C794491|nr:ionotropic receptor 40a [Anoplophora glabripennis]